MLMRPPSLSEGPRPVRASGAAPRISHVSRLYSFAEMSLPSAHESGQQREGERGERALACDRKEGTGEV